MYNLHIKQIEGSSNYKIISGNNSVIVDKYDDIISILERLDSLEKSNSFYHYFEKTFRNKKIISDPYTLGLHDYENELNVYYKTMPIWNSMISTISFDSSEIGLSEECLRTLCKAGYSRDTNTIFNKKGNTGGGEIMLCMLFDNITMAIGNKVADIMIDNKYNTEIKCVPYIKEISHIWHKNSISHSRAQINISRLDENGILIIIIRDNSYLPIKAFQIPCRSFIKNINDSKDGYLCINIKDYSIIVIPSKTSYSIYAIENHNNIPYTSKDITNYNEGYYNT